MRRRRRAAKTDVPPWLQEIISLLETAAAARYQSAAHIAFDLRHLNRLR